MAEARSARRLSKTTLLPSYRGLPRGSESWVQGDELLLEPQAPAGELTDQRQGIVEVQVVRPLARQRSSLDVLGPKIGNRPPEAAMDPLEAKDANPRGIVIPVTVWLEESLKNSEYEILHPRADGG